MDEASFMDVIVIIRRTIYKQIKAIQAACENNYCTFYRFRTGPRSVDYKRNLRSF